MRKDGQICGIVTIHVDDLLWGGNAEFSSMIIEPLKRRFAVSSECCNSELFQVPGTSDKPDQDFIIVMDQAHFVNKLEDVDIQTDDSPKNS